MSERLLFHSFIWRWFHSVHWELLLGNPKARGNSSDTLTWGLMSIILSQIIIVAQNIFYFSKSSYTIFYFSKSSYSRKCLQRVLSFSPPSFLKGVMVPSAPPDTMLTIAVNQLHKIWTWINYFRFGLPISKLYNILYLIVPSKFIMLILEFYSNSIPKYPWCIIWTSYYYCFFFFQFTHTLLSLLRTSVSRFFQTVKWQMYIIHIKLILSDYILC